MTDRSTMFTRDLEFILDDLYFETYCDAAEKGDKKLMKNLRALAVSKIVSLHITYENTDLRDIVDKLKK